MEPLLLLKSAELGGDCTGDAGGAEFGGGVAPNASTLGGVVGAVLLGCTGATETGFVLLGPL